jgi:hypothetical protein
VLATVTASGVPVTQGTVSFSINGTPLGSPMTVNNQGQVSEGLTLPPSFTPGSYTVNASYTDTTNPQKFGSSSGSAPVTIQPISTGTSLSASPNPSLQGQVVTFIATVTATSGSATPTGSVTFLDGPTALAVVPLSNGSASYSIAGLGVGNHFITAAYNPVGSFANSSASAIETVNQQSTPWTPPVLHKPFLLALFDQFLGGVETINATNRTETVTDNFFGIPLISTYDGSGNLVSVTLFGLNVTFFFSL